MQCTDHEWAESKGLLAVTLADNSPQTVVSALLECSTRYVLIAAHSEGGKSLLEVARSSWLDEQKDLHVCAVVLLDSVHRGPLPATPKTNADGIAAPCDDRGGQVPNILTKANTLHFVRSLTALGCSQPKPWIINGIAKCGCQTRSAGTMDHLLVPHFAREAAFSFFAARLEEVATL